jgi:hypothetical protein
VKDCGADINARNDKVWHNWTISTHDQLTWSFLYIFTKENNATLHSGTAGERRCLRALYLADGDGQKDEGGYKT